MGERLGQHFLKNKHFLRRIAGALELEPGDTVVEIGPGHGELTQEVIRQLGNSVIERVVVIAIEKDETLYQKLVNDPQFKKVTFVHGDALKILPTLTTKLPDYSITNLKIAGNIPFYLTGRLLRILGELERKPTRAVFTVQREVAERICAHPTRMNPTHRKCPMCGMNLLAASVQFWAEARVGGTIPREAFSPPPKVDSAILVLNSKAPMGDSAHYYPLVRALFKQPRKTILNNLIKADLDAHIQINDRRFVYKPDNQLNQPVKDASYNKMEEKKRWLMRNLEKIDINPQDRPQDLSVGAIIKLSEMWYNQNRR